MHVVSGLGLVLWCLGWVAPIVAGVLLWRRGAGGRWVGLALMLGGVLWLIASPAGWLLRPPTKGPEFASPDGRSAVWVKHDWGNRALVQWRDPAGKTRSLYTGPTRAILKEGPTEPRIFAWLPTGDRFYIGRSYVSRRGSILEAASGVQRGPTEEEYQWLLEQNSLDEADREWLTREFGEWQKARAGVRPSTP